MGQGPNLSQRPAASQRPSTRAQSPAVADAAVSLRRPPNAVDSLERAYRAPAAVRVPRSPALLVLAAGAALGGLAGSGGEAWLHKVAGKLPWDVSARELQLGRQAFEVWNHAWRAPASWTPAQAGGALKEAATLHEQLSTDALSRPQFDARMDALVRAIDRGPPSRPRAPPEFGRSVERAPSVLRPPGERSSLEPSRAGALTGEPSRQLEDAYRQRIADAADWVLEQSKHFPLLRAATQALIEEAARRFNLSNLDFVARAVDQRASAVQAQAMGRTRASAGQAPSNPPIGVKYFRNRTPIEPRFIPLMNDLVAAGSDPRARIVPALLHGLEEGITQEMMAARLYLKKRMGDPEVSPSAVDAYVTTMQGIQARLPQGSSASLDGEWKRDPKLIRQYAAVGAMLERQLARVFEQTSPTELADHVVGDRSLLWAFGNPDTLSGQDIANARARMRDLLGESTPRAEVLRYLSAVHLVLGSIVRELKEGRDNS
jgi:hypothetical protein